MLIRYLRFHKQASYIGINRLFRAPIASLMTIAVIGIVLALPVGFFVLLQNIQTISAGWNKGTQLSVYLKQHASQDQVDILKGYLNAQPIVANTQYVSPEAGLRAFEKEANIQGILKVLDENPLPSVIIVWLKQNNATPQQVQTLMTELEAKPQVDLVQLDMVWLKRLYAFLAIGKQFIGLLTAMLAVAVLLIIGNTIRLATQNHRDEVEVTKLIGAPTSFIRRPFLYTGACYGICGGALTWILVVAAVQSLQIPVALLAKLYDSTFHLQSLSFFSFFMLVFFGGLLGLIGAWIAVSREIRRMEPC